MELNRKLSLRPGISNGDIAGDIGLKPFVDTPIMFGTPIIQRRLFCFE